MGYGVDSSRVCGGMDLVIMPCGGRRSRLWSHFVWGIWTFHNTFRKQGRSPIQWLDRAIVENPARPGAVGCSKRLR